MPFRYCAKIAEVSAFGRIFSDLSYYFRGETPGEDFETPILRSCAHSQILWAPSVCWCFFYCFLRKISVLCSQSWESLIVRAELHFNETTLTSNVCANAHSKISKFRAQTAKNEFFKHNAICHNFQPSQLVISAYTFLLHQVTKIIVFYFRQKINLPNWLANTFANTCRVFWDLQKVLEAKIWFCYSNKWFYRGCRSAFTEGVLIFGMWKFS